MGELLKLREVADRLGISEPTARRYVKAGVLPSVYVGGSYRVRATDIEEFLRRAEVRPGENLPKAAAPSSEPEISGPDPRFWGDPSERPDPTAARIPEPSGKHIRVTVRDTLGSGASTVEITEESFLEVLRSVRRGEVSPEAVVERLRRESA